LPRGPPSLAGGHLPGPGPPGRSRPGRRRGAHAAGGGLMHQTATALRAGFTRGLIELRQSFTGAGLLGHLFWPVVTLVAIYFLRDRSFRASGFTLGALALPSVLGMFTALGMLLVVQ